MYPRARQARALLPCPSVLANHRVYKSRTSLYATVDSSPWLLCTTWSPVCSMRNAPVPYVFLASFFCTDACHAYASIMCTVGQDKTQRVQEQQSC